MNKNRTRVSASFNSPCAKPPFSLFSPVHFLLLAVGSFCVIGCKGKPHAEPPAPPLVEVTTVTQADVPIYHDWIGVLEGFVNAHIRAQVTGYLISQNYKEG